MRASELSAELARMAADAGDPEVMAYDSMEDLGPARMRYDVIAGREVLILFSGEVEEDPEE